MLVKLTLIVALMLSVNACTKSEDEQAEPVEENAGEQETTDASAEEPVEPIASDLGGANAEANVEMPANTAAEIPSNVSNVPVEAVPAEVPQSDVAAPTSAAGRVVRYAVNDTAILSGPEASASQVSILKKGESVLIEDLGAFGKIAEGKFVSKNDLSEKAVPKDSTSNPWK
jgi:hypothetical protein